MLKNAKVITNGNRNHKKLDLVLIERNNIIKEMMERIYEC
jgi:hypothetical protein